MRYAVVDVETTGLRPLHDRIVEIACVLVEDGAVLAQWSSLVDPGRGIPYYATAVHGIRDADVALAPRFEDVAPVLSALCDGCTVVAHNAAFDLGFLPMLQHHRSICTVRLARRAFPGAPNYKNQTLRTYLGLDADPALRGLHAHRALGDALITAAIFLRCMQAFERAQARPA